MLSLLIQQREIFFAIKSFEKARNDAGSSFALLRQKSMPPGNRADRFIRENFQPSLTEISVGETEISVAKPACLLIWTRNFYKGNSGDSRSQKPSQPDQPGSYEVCVFLIRIPSSFLFRNSANVKACCSLVSLIVGIIHVIFTTVGLSHLTLFGNDSFTYGHLSS